MIRPLQVYIEESELDRLEAWSRARGWTKSESVRAAIRALTRADQDEDPLLKASGMIAGLPADLSSEIGRYIEETFVAKEARSNQPKSARSRKRLRRH